MSHFAIVFCLQKYKVYIHAYKTKRTRKNRAQKRGKWQIQNIFNSILWKRREFFCCSTCAACIMQLFLYSLHFFSLYLSFHPLLRAPFICDAASLRGETVRARNHFAALSKRKCWSTSYCIKLIFSCVILPPSMSLSRLHAVSCIRLYTFFRRIIVIFCSHHIAARARSRPSSFKIFILFIFRLSLHHFEIINYVASKQQSNCGASEIIIIIINGLAFLWWWRLCVKANYERFSTEKCCVMRN